MTRHKHVPSLLDRSHYSTLLKSTKPQRLIPQRRNICASMCFVCKWRQRSSIVTTATHKKRSKTSKDKLENQVSLYRTKKSSDYSFQLIATLSYIRGNRGNIWCIAAVSSLFSNFTAGVSAAVKASFSLVWMEQIAFSNGGL